MIPSIDEFSPEYLSELHEDTILDRKIRTSKQGMWSTFVLVSKAQIQEKINGLRLER
jgi:hypothetical protein